MHNTVRKSLLTTTRSALTSKIGLCNATLARCYASVSMESIKILRQQTGAPLADCKKALESEGDVEKAKVWLRKKGLMTAEKKSGRTAAEGLIGIALTQDAHKAVLLEVNSETDFVSRSSKFQDMVNGVSQTALSLNSSSSDLTELKNATYHNTKSTVDEYVKELVGVIGENLQVRRWARMDITPHLTSNDPNTRVYGAIGHYVHNRPTVKVEGQKEEELTPHLLGSIGSVVGVKATVSNGVSEDVIQPKLKELGVQLTRQVTAANPSYLVRSDVPQSVLDKEREILMDQTKALPANQSKTPEILTRIVDAKLGKYVEENVLMEQKFIMDDKVTISKLLQKAGEDVEAQLKSQDSTAKVSFDVVGFMKFVVGEGIEKAEHNFAAEVQQQVKGSS